MLITLVVTLLIVGVLLWLVNNFLPMDEKIKQLLNAVVVIAAVVYVVVTLTGYQYHFPAR